MQNKECYNNIFQDERDLPFVPPAPHPGHDFDLFSLKNISILMTTSRKENNYKISEITCIHYKGKCILKILLCWIFGILIKQNHQKHCEMFTERLQKWLNNLLLYWLKNPEKKKAKSYNIWWLFSIRFKCKLQQYWQHVWRQLFKAK